jgi:cell division protein FtsL
MQDHAGDWWSGLLRIAFLPLLLLFTLFMTATTLLFSFGRRG